MPQHEEPRVRGAARKQPDPAATAALRCTIQFMEMSGTGKPQGKRRRCQGMGGRVEGQKANRHGVCFRVMRTFWN